MLVVTHISVSIRQLLAFLNLGRINIALSFSEDTHYGKWNSYIRFLGKEFFLQRKIHVWERAFQSAQLAWSCSGISALIGCFCRSAKGGSGSCRDPRERVSIWPNQHLIWSYQVSSLMVFNDGENNWKGTTAELSLSLQIQPGVC